MHAVRQEWNACGTRAVAGLGRTVGTLYPPRGAREIARAPFVRQEGVTCIRKRDAVSCVGVKLRSSVGR